MIHLGDWNPRTWNYYDKIFKYGWLEISHRGENTYYSGRDSTSPDRILISAIDVDTLLPNKDDEDDPEEVYHILCPANIVSKPKIPDHLAIVWTLGAHKKKM